MKLRNYALLLVVWWLATACAMPAGKITPPTSAGTAPRVVTVLAVNDIYRMDNLPYLRSLRAELERQNGEVLLLHAGDFLFPSLLSQRFDGEQMVDVLNTMDGDGSAFDPRMFITFGNHEFEKAKLKHAAMLQSRIHESQFAWLGSNVEFRTLSPGRTMVQDAHLLPSKIVTVNGIKVGLVSATTDTKGADYIQRFIPPQQVVRDTTRALRRQGAETVIALTHLSLGEDKALLEALGNDAPDLIIGGHEHERQSAQVNGRRIVKADADASSAAVVQLSLPANPSAGQPPPASLEYVELPGKYAADPQVQQRITQWEARFGQEYCGAQGVASDCLDEVLGKTQVELVAEELTIRRFETNLGDWLSDLARAQFAPQGAQVAFLNAGGMRLNQNIPAGNITRKHVDTLFAFPERLVLLKLTGAQLQQVAEHAITDWTGNGRWLQISGFAFRHDPASGKVTGLSLLTPQGPRLVRPDETILAVTSDYLIDASGDQDGYMMLGEKLLADPNLPRIELKDQVATALQAAGSAGIAPQVEGRVCNTQRAGACWLK